MKLITIVKSKNRPKTFAKTSLKYISRAGYDYRIYVKRGQYQRYLEAIADAEYKYYLYVPEENIKKGGIKIPKKYDLALYVPDNLKGFNDNKLLEFCREVNRMRSEFGKDKSMKGLNYEDMAMVKLND